LDPAAVADDIPGEQHHAGVFHLRLERALDHGRRNQADVRMRIGDRDARRRSRRA
jgi:hypothetical protein